ncbi:MAG TPA: hypothetical protein VGY66_31280 [Gemmataceae bacterium]|jgi:hypothetical protein|nr:hypothetical protein [Gemmataceae bacterium]
MSNSFLVFNVRSKRDAVLARDWARQVAALLGFEPLEQACIAAGVFEIASQAREHTRYAALHFKVQGDFFQVFAVQRQDPDEAATPSGLRLEKRLPKKELAVALEDVAWIVCQTAEQTHASLFTEVKRQNQELLHALAELRGCRAKIASLARETARPAA